MNRWLVACACAVTGLSCAGVSRDVSSEIATQLGADWIVIQYRFDGVPINCWRLTRVGISNERASDGIFWKDSTTGHLVHISGWYNRVQVSNGDFVSAARLVGVDASSCENGSYVGRQIADGAK
jgi:hypothetical protein